MEPEKVARVVKVRAKTAKAARAMGKEAQAGQQPPTARERMWKPEIASYVELRAISRGIVPIIPEERTNRRDSTKPR